MDSLAWGTLGALFIFALTTAVTPGPNNVLLMASGVNYGIRKSLPVLAGILVGFPSMVFLLGLGFTGLLTTSPVLFWVIKCLGLIYLVYLTWLIATSPVTDVEQTTQPAIGFKKTALLQWVNGKAWMMATGAIVAYSQPELSIVSQAGLFALVFFVTAIPTGLLWLCFGVSVKRFLKDPKHYFYFNQVMALLLLLSLLPIAYELVEQLLTSL